MNYTIADDRVDFEIDLKVISLSAVKRAAHKFSAVCGVSTLALGHETANLSLVVHSKGDDTAAAQDLANAFSRELLDCDLRDEVARQTEPLRNLLLAEAFSKTSILASQFESADFREDPFSISSPAHTSTGS